MFSVRDCLSRIRSFFQKAFFIRLFMVCFLLLATFSEDIFGQKETSKTSLEMVKKKLFNDLWFPPKGFKYSFRDERKPLEGLLTSGLLVRPKIRYRIKFRKRHLPKAQFKKRMKLWMAERNDQWLIPSMIKNWLHRNRLKDYKIIQYNKQFLLFRHYSHQKEGTDWETFIFLWKTTIGDSPTLLEVIFRLGSGEYPSDEACWKKIHSILGPILKPYPSKLTKKQVNHAFQNYQKMLLEKDLEMIRGNYKPSKSLKKPEKHKEEIAKRLTEKLQLKGHYSVYVKKRGGFHHRALREKEKYKVVKYIDFLRKNRELVEKRAKMKPAKRYYEETGWMIHNLDPEVLFANAIASKYIFSRFPCLIELNWLQRLGYKKKEERMEVLKKWWSKQEEKTFESLVKTCNEMVFRNVENGTWTEKKITKSMKLNLTKENPLSYNLEKYYEPLPGYKEMKKKLVRFYNQKKYKKAFQVVKTWWNKKGIPNTDRMKRVLEDELQEKRRESSLPVIKKSFK